MKILLIRSLILCAFIAIPCAAQAAKPEDEEADFPITIEDASPTDPGELDVRFVSRYEHTDSGDDRVAIAPELEYGIGSDSEINLVLPFDLGSADDDHGGDLGIEVLHSFVDEQAVLPELSASARVDVPTGENSAGADTTLRLLATKHVLQSFGQHALHANVSWSHNAQASDGERDNYYLAAIGTSHGLTDKTALVTDIVREQDKDAGQTENLIEAGLRHAIQDDTIASVGTGFGIGDESPAIRITFGVQKSF